MGSGQRFLLGSIASLIRDPFYLLIRLYFGIGLATHGYQKLLNLQQSQDYFQSLGVPLPFFAVLACVWVELIGGLLFSCGLYTQLVSFVMALNMFAAIVLGHKNVLNVDVILHEPWQIVNLNATRYLLVFLFVFIEGPGRLSLDYLCRKVAYIRNKRD